MDSLLQQLTGKLSAFVGQSGVGKSSIINALLPEAQIKEGAVSTATNKGIHTTSVSRLYHIKTTLEADSEPLHARLIDSPGVREFGLWDISKEDVIHGFVELQHYAGHCYFRDCKHINEPDCAVLKAIEENTVSSQRLASYQRIVESISE